MSTSLTDTQFMQQLESLQLPASEFNHQGHLRAAFLFLQRAPLLDAQQQFARTLLRYASHLGAPQKYHATITYALLAIMAARQSQQQHAGWQSFNQANQDLSGDARALLAQFYSDELLASDKARERFVLPDRRPLQAMLSVIPA